MLLSIFNYSNQLHFKFFFWSLGASPSQIIIKLFMTQSFASISALIDSIVEEEVHSKSKSKNSLYLTASSEQPLHFYDVSKVKLNFSQDDLESYLRSNPSITFGSTILLENCDVNIEYGKENDVVSCQVDSKKLTISVGTDQQKKIKDSKVRLQVENQDEEIPLLPSTRRYIRRIKKLETVRKQKTSKIDILSFISSKNTKGKNYLELKDEIFDDIGLLDTDSLKIIQKLTNFINKDELFSLLASKPLKSKVSKKAVRLMVIPNDKEIKGELVFKKKNYGRQDVEEMCRQYELRQN